MKPSIVIGIAGGSGAGKSTLVARLLAGPHGECISVLPHDAYYRDGQAIPKSASGSPNWDHPDALDNELYHQHINALIGGTAVNRPTYDFAYHCRRDETVTVIPKAVLLLEGILLFAIPSLRDLMDLKVFVDTPADLRVLRRMVRDIRERGRTLDSIETHYLDTVRPMHEQFVHPSRSAAHVLIPWVTNNLPGLRLLNAQIAEAAGAT